MARKDERRKILASELFDSIYTHLDTWLPVRCDDFAEVVDDDILRDLGTALITDIMDKIKPIYDALCSGEYESLIKTRQLFAEAGRKDLADDLREVSGLDGQPLDDLHKIYKGRSVSK